MKIFSSFIGILLGIISFTSCNKKSDPDTNQSTKTDQISASAWKYENAGIDFNKDGNIDQALSALAPGVIQPCQTDNTITFKKDNSGVVDEGASKCNTADPQTTNFNWNFTENETNLNITNNILPFLSGKFKIVALTATNFSLSKDTTFLNSNVTLVVTLKH